MIMAFLGASGLHPISEPLVSVVIPVFNGAGVVGETVGSVLSQTHRNLEVLVVDDGSTDATVGVVRAASAGDSRVRILTQANGGVAAARNHGLEEASGPVVAFVDADDLWKPQKIAKQLECLELAGPDVGVVYTWSVDIDQDGMVVPPVRPKPPYRGNVLSAILLQNFIGNASAPLMRTSVVKRVGGYSPDLINGLEDWHLYVRLAETCDFEVVPEFLTGYRQTPNSMSRDVDHLLANFRQARSDLWDSHRGLPPALHLWSELYLLSWVASRALSEGRRILGSRLLLQMLSVGIRRDPLLPFRGSVKLFVRYLLEIRKHGGASTPGSFLDSKLEVDDDEWRRALDLRRAFLREVAQ